MSSYCCTANKQRTHMEHRTTAGRPPTYVLSAEDLGVLNMPGNTLATMVAHLRCKYPNITERIVQSLRTKRIPSAVRIDLRVPSAHGSREHATRAAAPAEQRCANDQSSQSDAADASPGTSGIAEGCATRLAPRRHARTNRALRTKHGSPRVRQSRSHR